MLILYKHINDSSFLYTSVYLCILYLLVSESQKNENRCLLYLLRMSLTVWRKLLEIYVAFAMKCQWARSVIVWNRRQTFVVSTKFKSVVGSELNSKYLPHFELIFRWQRLLENMLSLKGLTWIYIELKSNIQATCKIVLCTYVAMLAFEKYWIQQYVG